MGRKDITPSPKLQRKLAESFVLFWIHIESRLIIIEFKGVGGCKIVTTICFVKVLEPMALVAMRVTLYNPELV